MGNVELGVALVWSREGVSCVIGLLGAVYGFLFQRFYVRVRLYYGGALRYPFLHLKLLKLVFYLYIRFFIQRKKVAFFALV